MNTETRPSLPWSSYCFSIVDNASTSHSGDFALAPYQIRIAVAPRHWPFAPSLLVLVPLGPRALHCQNFAFGGLGFIGSDVGGCFVSMADMAHRPVTSASSIVRPAALPSGGAAHHR